MSSCVLHKQSSTRQENRQTIVLCLLESLPVSRGPLLLSHMGDHSVLATERVSHRAIDNLSDILLFPSVSVFFPPSYSLFLLSKEAQVLMVVKKQFIAEETLKGREERCVSWVFVLFCFSL